MIGGDAVLPRKKASNAAAIESIDYAQCPAKTWLREDGKTQLGRTVIEHCQIVGEVARAMIARYPQTLQARLFPDDAAFAAASHDIGKVSPFFVEKLLRACSPEHQTLATLGVNPALEKDWGGHAGVSQVAAAAMNAPEWVPQILRQHHGFTPPLSGRRADAEVFGGVAWQEQRDALVFPTPVGVFLQLWQALRPALIFILRIMLRLMIFIVLIKGCSMAVSTL